MKAYKACCLCGKEGHLSHACPLNKYRAIDDETAKRIALAIHEADADALFKETALRLNKDDRQSILRNFLDLMEQPCSNSPSSPLH